MTEILKLEIACLEKLTKACTSFEFWVAQRAGTSQ